MDRVDYWDRFFQMDSIIYGLVVVGGDINFTLGASEFWGHATQVDYLSNYFIKKLEPILLDIEPT